MEIRDIPQEMMDGIRLRFESTQEILDLRARQAYAQRVGHWDEALEIGRRVEFLFPIVLRRYLEEAEHSTRSFDLKTSGMSDSDKDELMEKVMVLFMACDIIESAEVDMNDILHRTVPDVDITMFSDIRQTSEMAKEKLRYLQEKGDYMKDLTWAERCDDMYEMMCSKARSIVRKRKASKDWGRNTERLANR